MRFPDAHQPLNLLIAHLDISVLVLVFVVFVLISNFNGLAANVDVLSGRVGARSRRLGVDQLDYFGLLVTSTAEFLRLLLGRGSCKIIGVQISRLL